MDVTLEPVDKDNVIALCRLQTKPGQERFVAPNTAGETELELSFVPGEDEPQGFYARLGFADTGRTLEDERVWRKDL